MQLLHAIVYKVYIEYDVDIKRSHESEIYVFICDLYF